MLDEHGRKTGQIKPRSAVHRDGDWHRTVLTWVINDRGEVLLQRRAADKDSWPNYLDVSSGGHVVAGEDPLTAAVNELHEELGIAVQPEELQLLDSYPSQTRPSENFINNTFYDLYLLRTGKTLSELTPQLSEISELKYVPLAEFQAMVARHDPDLIPNGQTSAHKLFKALGLED